MKQLLLILMLLSPLSALAQSASEVTEEMAAEIFLNLSKANALSGTCASTAQVWEHEIKTKFHLKAGKVFIFLTPASNSALVSGWWYHVAPYLKVNGKIVILDPDYEKAPKPLKDWVSKHDAYPGDCAKNLNIFIEEQLLKGSTQVNTCSLRIIDDPYVKYPGSIVMSDQGRHPSKAEYRESLIESCQSAFGRTFIAWSRNKCEKFLGLLP